MARIPQAPRVTRLDGVSKATEPIYYREVATSSVSSWTMGTDGCRKNFTKRGANTEHTRTPRERDPPPAP